MKVLPAAIEYQTRVEPGMVRIQVESCLVSEFLWPYQWQFPNIRPKENGEKLMEFPLETTKDAYVEEVAAAFFGSHENFFHHVGFPKSARGNYQKRLWKNRYDNWLNYGQIFYAPIDREIHACNQYDHDLWQRYLVESGMRDIPLYTPNICMPPRLMEIASKNSYVDPQVPWTCTWLMATELLKSRYYLGVDGFFAQLAVLLGLPAIILGTPDNKHLRWRREDVFYLEPMKDGCYDYRELYEHCGQLEGMLVSEH